MKREAVSDKTDQVYQATAREVWHADQDLRAPAAESDQ